MQRTGHRQPASRQQNQALLARPNKQTQDVDSYTPTSYHTFLSQTKTVTAYTHPPTLSYYPSTFQSPVHYTTMSDDNAHNDNNDNESKQPQNGSDDVNGIQRRESLPEIFDDNPPSMQVFTLQKSNRPHDAFLLHASEVYIYTLHSPL